MSGIGRDDKPAQPFGWELPAGGALCWVLVAVLLIPAGQGLACLVTGGGWVWPGPNLMPSVAGLCTGHPGRGLPRVLARRVPPSTVVYTAIAVCQAALAALPGLGVWVWRREFADTRGWASRRDAQDALGAERLYRRRREIRPDLYPARTKRKERA